jgi:hypothetical protein
MSEQEWVKQLKLFMKGFGLNVEWTEWTFDDFTALKDWIQLELLHENKALRNEVERLGSLRVVREMQEEISAIREQILILGKAKQACEKENKALREEAVLCDRTHSNIEVQYALYKEEISALRSQLHQYQSKTVNVVAFHRLEDALKHEESLYSQKKMECQLQDIEIGKLRHSLEVARVALLIITEEYEQDFAISRCAKKMRDKAFEALASLSALSKKEEK